MMIYLQLIETPEDQSKFEKIYNLYLLRMQYIAESILNDSGEAENVVHDTFLTLIENLEKVDDKDCHKTWNYIVTILKNKCFNIIKKNKKIIYSEDYQIFESQTHSSSEELVIEKELTADLVNLIQNMKFPYKEVLYLRYYNEMSLKEISNLLQIDYSNTRQIFVRGKKKLKQQLEERGYHYDNR